MKEGRLARLNYGLWKKGISSTWSIIYRVLKLRGKA